MSGNMHAQGRRSDVLFDDVGVSMSEVSVARAYELETIKDDSARLVISL